LGEFRRDQGLEFLDQDPLRQPLQHFIEKSAHQEVASYGWRNSAGEKVKHFVFINLT
jgi:hypothetical protein